MLRALCFASWCCLLAGGLLGSALSDSRLGAWDTELRFASSLALVVAALVSWRQAGLGVALFVAGAMGLGAMGDASPLWGRDWSAGSRLVTTMILFGLGHLGYLAALRALRIQSKRSFSGTSGEGTNAVVLFAFLASVVIGIVSWNLIVVASDTLVARQLHWPSLVYSLILSITAGGLVTFAARTPVYRLSGVGGILFFVSDILLGLNIFQKGAFHHPVDWIWICYGVGQMLIVSSLTQARQESNVMSHA